MATTTCNTCGEHISEAAKVCFHCGAPQSPVRRTLFANVWWLVVGGIAIVWILQAIARSRGWGPGFGLF